MSVVIEKINSVIRAYFINNPSVEIVPAKDLMPAFIAAGIFNKDVKMGKPIRDVLRALDSSKQLHLMPNVHLERKEQNTYWYFIPENATRPNTFYKQDLPSAEKQEAKKARGNSDESYVIDLCDTVLQQTAKRQARFPFLVGDAHKDGKSTTQLPVDAFYESLKLVIEYNEPQHTKAVSHFDKPETLTVSGVHRGEQRKLYDERKKTLLPENGIKVVVIPYSAFDFDSKGKIKRDREKDMEVVRGMLEGEGVELGE